VNAAAYAAGADTEGDKGLECWAVEFGFGAARTS
jgi:hypothetical protein